MKLLTLLTLLLSGTVLAQYGKTVMKKYESQLPQEGRGNVHVPHKGKNIDQMIYEFMEEEGIPGMALVIVQAPYILQVVGYGVTDLEKGNLAAAKTLWPIGPISQGFTAVAVMQLYERGKLNLDDPIGKYLKDIPQSWKDINILQLMQHSSGIADYREQKSFNVSADYQPIELVKMIESLPLSFKPGTNVKQNATNFLLLSSIIEKISKMSYHDFVKKYQIDYLGLQQTYFGEDLAKVKQKDVTFTADVYQTFKKNRDFLNLSETTTGYVEKDGKLVVAPIVSPTAMKGFSDIWASAENVSHWNIALAEGVLIAKPENRNMIYKTTTLTNGKKVPAMAGWQFYNHKGLMDIKGTVSGHSVFLSRFKNTSELVCVTLLTNKEGVDLTNLGRKISAAFEKEKMGTGANENLLYMYESQFSVAETMTRIEEILNKMEIPVFAKFDHRKNAEEVDLKLRPNQVIVFGSPKVGTKLMQDNPSISNELPLKISVWEDKDGSVWTTFPQMKVMASQYGLEGEPVIRKMQELLLKIVIQSASVY